MSSSQDPFYIVKDEIQDSGRKVDELEKEVSVAARDPAWYGINEVELDKRRRWTRDAHSQVGTVKKAVVAGNESSCRGTNDVSGMPREPMRLPDSHRTDRSNQQQDDELDELSTSVERIGGVGLAIHEDLLAQRRRL